ncbi:LysR family transcriptional regulator [Thiospirochaeta perfilievii]|uniref:LysR family transcriptional regulator n=1 Tax=Thiospirochaeta perfilievii TaxID=252967 RepID=A0A5C1QCY5_9SPIO|nr:LysR family transcriptional regulator [Thiospirochaeta perfilievii]QEN05277.1 LysR family transcriptional regulator [Thiospirochaeta perfilievii]
MNTRALQCFIKVYEKKSITAAAKEIYISPQGLSKIIKQLEIELETELFFRGSHGMESTESGELLYARARHICYLMEDIKKEIGIINGSRGALNVIVSASATFFIPLDLIYSFSDEHPNQQLKIQDHPDSFPINDLFQEQADVGIIICHEGIDNCNYNLLHRGEIVLVVSKDHPFAIKDEVSITDLENEMLVLKAIDSGKDHILIEKCLDLGITPVIKHESESLSTIHHLCESQNVVGVSIDFVEDKISNDRIRVIRLKEVLPVNLYFISKNREVENRSIKLFYDYLKQSKG